MISVAFWKCKNQTFAYPGVTSAPLFYLHTPKMCGVGEGEAQEVGVSCLSNTELWDSLEFCIPKA